MNTALQDLNLPGSKKISFVFKRDNQKSLEEIGDIELQMEFDFHIPKEKNKSIPE